MPSFQMSLWSGRPCPSEDMAKIMQEKCCRLHYDGCDRKQEMWEIVMVICSHRTYKRKKNRSPLKIYQENLWKGINKQLFWPLLSSNIWMLRSKNWKLYIVKCKWRMKQASLNSSEMNFKESAWVVYIWLYISIASIFSFLWEAIVFSLYP